MWHDTLELCLEPIMSFYNSHTALCRGIVVVCAGVAVVRWIRPALNRRQMKKIREGYPRDTVILHQLGRGPYAPSMTPYAVKVETYLRMAKIPYQNDHSMQCSSKQKFPWITYNGEDVADSAFCLEFLNTQRTVDLNSWLSPEQRATALAFQCMVEDNLYWVGLVARWVNEIDEEFMGKAFKMPAFLAWLIVRYLIGPKYRKQAWMQGMGRHSQEEIRHIARKDFTALSDFLGQKQFLMGDRPCEQDCTVFGILSQILWQIPGPTGDIIKEFPVLVTYCERMKDKFWPDWLQCTTQGGTVPSTT